MSEPCYLYIIESDFSPFHGHECFKVGISNNVGTRLSTIQTSVPFQLSVRRKVKLPSRDAARHLERQMHKTLNCCVLKGEWFCTQLFGVLFYLDQIVEEYWINHGGSAEKLPEWFAQVGLEPSSARRIIAEAQP